MQQHAMPLAQELTLFLVCAGIIVPLFKHIKINPVLGFLFMGMLLGSTGLGALVNYVPLLSYVTINESHDVTVLAEWGVIFLMFTIGLELSLDRLWRMRQMVFGLGTAQIVLCGLVIGLVAYGWGNSVAASILLGCSLALSSTAVVLQLFNQNGHLGSNYGQTNLSILLMQDLAVVPLLFMVTLFGEQQTAGALESGRTIWLSLFSTLGFGFAMVILMYLIGRKVLSPLLHMVAQTKSSELFMAASLVIIIACANLTGIAGLSMALGAFLAGLLLAETEFRHTIEVDIAPFRGLLLGLFFMSVGLSIDLEVLKEKVGWVVASAAGLFLIKSAVITLLCRSFRLPWSSALPSGIMLAQGGEFAFVVVGLAVAYQLLPEDTGHFMMLVASFTMMITPILAQFADKLWQHLLSRETDPDHNEAPDASIPEKSNHVIIAGFGRVAKILARMLNADDITFVSIEKDAIKVKEAQSQGLPVFYGDVSRFEILKAAHINHAQMLVVTMDDGLAAERLVTCVRHDWPELFIIARARDISHAQRLLIAGANDVILETIEASLQISSIILQKLGIPDMLIQQRIQMERQTENDDIQRRPNPKNPA